MPNSLSIFSRRRLSSTYAMTVSPLGFAYRVAAEGVAQRSQHLLAERLLLTRTEAGVERRGQHQGRHVLLDRVEHRPATLAGVLDVALDPLEPRVVLER